MVGSPCREQRPEPISSGHASFSGLTPFGAHRGEISPLTWPTMLSSMFFFVGWLSYSHLTGPNPATARHRAGLHECFTKNTSTRSRRKPFHQYSSTSQPICQKDSLCTWICLDSTRTVAVVISWCQAASFETAGSTARAFRAGSKKAFLPDTHQCFYFFPNS